MLEVLTVQGARTGLKKTSKSKLLRLGTSKDEKVLLGNTNVDQVESFTDLGSIKWN